MRPYEAIIRPLLFLLGPESAHNLALWLIARGFVRSRIVRQPALEQELFGVRFPNPLGLAAGFDKNAVAVARWAGLGFGFAEVGTVTQFPQPGNPKPRLFRLPKDQAIVNSLGFNNDGARTVAGRLAEAKAGIPLGVNLGLSRSTPLEAAAADYQASFTLLRPFGDYFVVNVSSPNTPGLRGLQERGALDEIVAAIQEIGPDKPLFVKVSPDLDAETLDGVVRVAHERRLTGLIATNTTVSREGLKDRRRFEGGLSGRPLRELADRNLQRLYKSCDPNLILIGVGGIFEAEDLYRKISFGAHLCQAYTGWVYRGPSFAADVLEGLLRLMEERGVGNLCELRGSGVAL